MSIGIISDVAVEPDTWGIIGASGNNLVYWDRREPMPENLSSTTIKSSPMYGLDVQYDILIPSMGNSRTVILLPKAYGNSSNMVKWRYISEDPEGSLLIINPNGTTSSYTGSSGWQDNLVFPKPVRFVVDISGTYTFTLECMGQDGVISEASFPYPNLIVPDTCVINMSEITNRPIQSVFYDWCKRLWIWDGQNLIPIKPVYDYYTLDPVERNLYFTRNYSGVNYT